eukprot:c35963_g1_i1 orf=123-407(+)
MQEVMAEDRGHDLLHDRRRERCPRFLSLSHTQSTVTWKRQLWRSKGWKIDMIDRCLLNNTDRYVRFVIVLWHMIGGKIRVVFVLLIEKIYMVSE